MKKSAAVLCFLVLIAVLAAPALAAPSTYELTITDITTIPTITSRQISVLGVTLGMTLAEAEQKLKSNPQFNVENNPYIQSRFDVYERKQDGAQVFSCFCPPDGNRLAEIVIFQDFAKYLKGGTKTLLTQAVFDQNSAIRRTFR